MTERRTSLWLVLAGLGIIVLGATLWGLFGEAAARDATRPTDFTAVPVAVDLAAPILALRDLNGIEHSLADYLGQVTLINLWATWCPPCEAEMPVLKHYYEKHRSQDFVVIAINDGEAKREVEQFAALHDLTFPVWLDPEYDATERAFKAANLPTSYVIDRSGRVRLMWIGAISAANLEKYVTPIIEE